MYFFLVPAFFCVGAIVASQANSGSLLAECFAEKAVRAQENVRDLSATITQRFIDLLQPPREYRSKISTINFDTLEHILEKVAVCNEEGLCAVITNLISGPERDQDAWKLFAAKKAQGLITQEQSCLNLRQKIDELISARLDALKYKNSSQRLIKIEERRASLEATVPVQTGAANSAVDVTDNTDPDLDLLDLPQESFFDTMKKRIFSRHALYIGVGALALTIVGVALYKFFKKPKEKPTAALSPESSVPETDIKRKSNV
jgi:hypothetical protein